MSLHFVFFFCHAYINWYIHFHKPWLASLSWTLRNWGGLASIFPTESVQSCHEALIVQNAKRRKRNSTGAGASSTNVYYRYIDVLKDEMSVSLWVTSEKHDACRSHLQRSTQPLCRKWLCHVTILTSRLQTLMYNGCTSVLSSTSTTDALRASVCVRIPWRVLVIKSWLKL